MVFSIQFSLATVEKTLMSSTEGAWEGAYI